MQKIFRIQGIDFQEVLPQRKKTFPFHERNWMARHLECLLNSIKEFVLILKKALEMNWWTSQKINPENILIFVVEFDKHLDNAFKAMKQN